MTIDTEKYQALHAQALKVLDAFKDVEDEEALIVLELAVQFVQWSMGEGRRNMRAMTQRFISDMSAGIGATITIPSIPIYGHNSTPEAVARLGAGHAQAGGVGGASGPEECRHPRVCGWRMK